MVKNAACPVQIVLDEVNNSCLTLQRHITPVVTLLRLTMPLCLASSFINTSHDLQERYLCLSWRPLHQKNQTWEKRGIREPSFACFQLTQTHSGGFNEVCKQ